ncbi:universal stress protein [Winogradskyella sp. PC D3.3]
MRQHILLPTDYSENAMSAIDYALNLYKNQTCTFYLLHTWAFTDTGSRTYITSTYLDQLKEESKNRLEEIKTQLKTENSETNHKFESIHSTESLLPTIKKAIKDHKINLVIMGTKGATGAKEFFYGSNTVNIIQKIRLCPVLVVPNEHPFVKPEQIAFPTDFNRFYGEELLPLKQLTKLYNSRIRIVHINESKTLSDKQNYNLAMLKAYLEDYQTSVHWMPDFETKEQAINDFIKEFNIDILVMVNYKHSFIENITKEPVINKIGFHCIVPFLVIPAFK